MSEDEWKDIAAASSAVATTLKPLGTAVCASLLEHGYMLATANMHVILGHGDRSDLINGQPWQVGTIALLMVAATLCRVAMTMQPMHRNAWMATASFFFLSATVVWALFLVPVLLRRRSAAA